LFLPPPKKPKVECQGRMRACAVVAFAFAPPPACGFFSRPRVVCSRRRAPPLQTVVHVSEDDDGGEGWDESDDDVWGDDAAAGITEGLGFTLAPLVEGGEGEDVELDGEATPPRIVWDPAVVDYFWSDSDPDAESEEASSKARVANMAGWPVLHLRGLLSREALAEAQANLKVLARSALTSPIEQFGGGSEGGEGGELVRTSRVANISPGGAPKREYGSGGAPGWVRQARKADPGAAAAADGLREAVLKRLPPPLRQTGEAGGGPGHAFGHPFEDGSLVLYDRPGDFYGVHHDSWSPGARMFPAQRAFTVLVYLVSPADELGTDLLAGSPCGGGTEFPNLLGKEGGAPLVLRPAAGDAIVWPNFDRDGSYSELPLHRALAIEAAAEADTEADTEAGAAQDPAPDREGATFRKAVLNLWFEAQCLIEKS